MSDRNPVYVMMPVKCVGKLCSNCPYLKIDTEVQDYTGIGISAYSTDLKCRSVNRCILIQQMMDGEQHE